MGPLGSERLPTSDVNEPEEPRRILTRAVSCLASDDSRGDTLREWILFFHVLSAVIWLGGSIYVEALSAAARRGGDKAVRVAVMRRIGTTNRRLFNLAGISTIVFGFWLVFESPGWEFEMMWIVVGIVMAALAVVVDLFFTTPRIDQIEVLADDEEEESVDRLSVLLREVVMAGHARVGMLFIALVFMVFKP